MKPKSIRVVKAVFKKAGSPSSFQVYFAKFALNSCLLFLNVSGVIFLFTMHYRIRKYVGVFISY